MAEHEGAFEENIHNREYRKKYTVKKIDASYTLYDHFRKSEKLDGIWNHHADVYDTCLRQEWFTEPRKDEEGWTLPWDWDFNEWDTIKVPSTWNTQQEQYKLYEGSMLYTRTFRYEKEDSEKVVLKIGAAYHNSMVFLNGSFLGYHEGGDTPFYLDVTDHLLEDNRIVLSVNNTRTPGRIPTIFTDWYNYGGLYRSVELFRLPSAYISNFKIALVPGSKYSRVKAEITIEGEGIESACLEIGELGISETLKLSGGRGSIEFDCSPELWSPENPKLYDVTVSAGGDTIRERTGFREFKVVGSSVFLNGEAIKLRGVSCHEESVPNGKSVTEAEIRENFALIKELKGNFMRLAHYPHTEMAARIADELGVLLWEEIPVYWAIHFENKETIDNGRQQLTELIKRDYNRPSVIIWSVGNENPDTDERLTFMGGLADLARELDDTRAISAACLWDQAKMKIDDRLADKLDIIGINEYFGWYNPHFDLLEEFFNNSHPDKPVIITELGAGAKAGHHGGRNEMFTEEYQERTYEEQIRCIQAQPWIAGISPWILYDFRTPVRCNKFQKGYNLKGLLSADKSHRKLAFFVLKDFFGSWKVS